MWKTSALISLMFIIGALLDIYMGKDINYNCGVSLFFTGISIVCKQIEISIKNSNKQQEAEK